VGMYYRYNPVRFYAIVFAVTWAFWFSAVGLARNPAIQETGAHMVLMLLGLFTPAVTAIVTVFHSRSKRLKAEFREKLLQFSRIDVRTVLASVMLIFVIIAVSILISTLPPFGQSLGQFSFTEDFSFSIGGLSTLLVLVLTAFLEELGWRGYAEDSIGQYFSWWKECLISGGLWAVWHLPLFFIPETYQSNILSENPLYMVNFFVSILPLDILFAWVYVRSRRSIAACMFFHFFVNFLQERIAMTQVTKCVETGVLFAAAAVIILLNKHLFFETDHIGRLIQAED
jgi:membrane protease YdiL (CAAX protease family)